jgi:hypothetical protein
MSARTLSSRFTFSLVIAAVLAAGASAQTAYLPLGSSVSYSYSHPFSQAYYGPYYIYPPGYGYYYSYPPYYYHSYPYYYSYPPYYYYYSPGFGFGYGFGYGGFYHPYLHRQYHPYYHHVYPYMRPYGRLHQQGFGGLQWQHRGRLHGGAMRPSWQATPGRSGRR